ncbi:hypothetical protein OJ997_15425 [Solirubrobacter phytolaccae]|uniref:Uncharacterized protein n=1 Tax=Solirubrobacter phytolaccae TaxID=1404360 RepID=A0A9X3N925_9ACTN|nr:hypothetical protein [Solirubrobacter phytolaccae]MDA0181696.1 hypothetical protein [Solirubrobacter phytolaccae]
MIVDIAFWDVDDVDALHAATAVEEWRGIDGLRLKLWIVDRERGRWGAIMLWDGERPASLPPNRAAELIGRPADHRLTFDVAEVAP